MTELTVSRFDLIGRTLRLPLLPQERLVLIYLVQHIRTSGKRARQTWVKQRQIAEELGTTDRAVRRHLDKLVASGQLQRWRQPHGYLYRIPPTWDEVHVASVPRVRLQRPLTREDEPWE